MQTQNYVSETSRSDQEKLCRERIATGVSIKQLVSNNYVAGLDRVCSETRHVRNIRRIMSSITLRHGLSLPLLRRIGKASFSSIDPIPI